MRHLFKCKSCNLYTMKESCPRCQQKATLPKPPKYSPEDKYAKYRRIWTSEQRKKEDLL